MKSIKISINFAKFSKFTPIKLGQPIFDMNEAIKIVRELKIPNVRLKQKNKCGSVLHWDNF